MADKDYYTSERFIWDSLIDSAKHGMAGLNSSWRARRRVDPFLVLWPAEAVQTQEGQDIDGPITRRLGSEDRWHAQTVQAIKVANAYALLRVVQRDDHVEVILESHHGARHWKLDITRSGDVDVLKAPKQQPDDQEAIGLLFKPGSEN